MDTLLVDVGGTKMRIVSPSGEHTIGSPVILKTPKKLNEAVDLILQKGEEVLGRSPGRIIMGLPGRLSPDEGILITAPHLPEWSGANLRHQFALKSTAEFYFENDTHLVGLGEAHYGAGKGHDIVAYITVSTGVGGVRIIGGNIDRHRFGFEIGHHIIDTEFIRDNNSGKGTFESELEHFISGSAIEAETGIAPYEITEHEFWLSRSSYVAVGVYNVALFWSPDVIVLGGSMMNSIGYPIEAISELVTSWLGKDTPPIVHAKLGDFGGLYGGLVIYNSWIS